MKPFSRYQKIHCLLTTVLLAWQMPFSATAEESAPACGSLRSNLVLSSGAANAESTAFLAYSEQAHGAGRLAAYAVDETGSLGARPLWDTHTGIFAEQHWDSGRNILTYKPSARSGVALRWPDNPGAPGMHELDPGQIDILRRDPVSGDLQDFAQGRDRLEYLRGNDTKAGPAAHQFRPRSGKLGDFADASPLFVGSATLAGKELNRTPMLYIGSNAGMLHGLNALSGREEIAYLPSALMAALSQSTQQGAARLSHALASPVAGDAGEHTVLLAALAGGGQSVFALDISDPEQFTEQNAAQIVLWEFNDSDDADLGFIQGQTKLAAIAPGRHVAIFGNGYHSNAADNHISAGATAVLFIVDAVSGVLLDKLDTGVGPEHSDEQANGLSAPEVIDSDGDGYADIAYAGDAYGNLWKFRKTNGSNWEIAYRQALFSINPAQPILMPPRVIAHPQGGFVIVFASGALDTDQASDAVHALFAVWDKNQETLDRPIVLADLVEQKILEQKTVRFDSTSMPARITSNYAVDWRTRLGWYMVFDAAGSGRGEQVIAEPVIRNGLLIVPTGLASSGTCIPDQHSWLTVIDALTGKRSPASPFDLNADGRFSSSSSEQGDFVASATETDQPLVAVSALQPANLTAAARILASLPGEGNSPAELILLATDSYTPFSLALNPFSQRRGRLSWRQLLQ